MVWTIRGGGDTYTLLAVHKKLNFLHSQVDRDVETLCFTSHKMDGVNIPFNVSNVMEAQRSTQRRRQSKARVSMASQKGLMSPIFLKNESTKNGS